MTALHDTNLEAIAQAWLAGEARIQHIPSEQLLLAVVPSAESVSVASIEREAWDSLEDRMRDLDPSMVWCGTEFLNGEPLVMYAVPRSLAAEVSGTDLAGLNDSLRAGGGLSLTAL